MITDVALDTENQVIITAISSDKHFLRLYSFTGELVGKVGHTGKNYPRLAMDTKRHIICMTDLYTSEITLFNDECKHTGEVRPTGLEDVIDTAYVKSTDEYVLADAHAHMLQFLPAGSEQLRRSVPADECRYEEDNPNNACIATTKGESVPLIATLDRKRSMVKLYSKEGEYIREFGGAGSGYGQMDGPSGLCFDYKGRILVCDQINGRIVRISPDANEDRHWDSILQVDKLGVGSPVCVDVAEDGILVVVTHKADDQEKVLSHIVLLGSYD